MPGTIQQGHGEERALRPGVLLLLGSKLRTEGFTGSLVVGEFIEPEEKNQAAQMVSYGNQARA